jgi:hypothetical protein
MYIQHTNNYTTNVKCTERNNTLGHEVAALQPRLVVVIMQIIRKLHGRWKLDRGEDMVRNLYRLMCSSGATCLPVGFSVE